jgi:hypothetical protein
MRSFILRHNIVRFRDLLAETMSMSECRVLGEPPAEALREQAILESVTDGVLEDIDLLQALVHKTIFPNDFEAAHDAYMLLDPHKGPHIVDMNEAYATAAMTHRDRVCDNKLCDIFPDNPAVANADGASNLFVSLKRVAETGIKHIMGVQRYDIRDNRDVFVTKYWLPVNRPIFDANDRLVYLLHNVTDATSEGKFPSTNAKAAEG